MSKKNLKKKHQTELELIYEPIPSFEQIAEEAIEKILKHILREDEL